VAFEVEPVVIAGAGALGSVYAGLLAAAGVDVTVLARGAHEEALRQAQLELRLPTMNRRVGVRVADRAAANCLILTSRLFDSSAVLDRVDGEPQLAISLQNGVGKNDALSWLYGDARLARATSTVAAELLAPGIVKSVSLGRTYLDTDVRADALADLLAKAGIPVERTDGATAEWSKLTQVAAIMGLQAVTRRFLHELLLSADAAVLFCLICREVQTLAAQCGCDLADLPAMLPVRTIAVSPADDTVALLRAQGEQLLAAGATDRRTSLLRAVEAGRRSELDGIIGETVRRGHGAGLEMPTLETVWRLALASGVED
jgi:2-dehydropantoate 2-reductase